MYLSKVTKNIIILKTVLIAIFLVVQLGCATTSQKAYYGTTLPLSELAFIKEDKIQQSSPFGIYSANVLSINDTHVDGNLWEIKSGQTVVEIGTYNLSSVQPIFITKEEFVAEKGHTYKVSIARSGVDDYSPIIEDVTKKTISSESPTEELVNPKEKTSQKHGASENYRTGTQRDIIWKDNFTGIELVLIKGGCYQMGDTFGDGENEELPVHEVCIDDFYIGKYEVTQGQWEKVMGFNPSGMSGGRSVNNPVDNVSWNNAQAFINKLNNETGKNFRLPTEAEWEYAARSKGKKEKWAGTSKKKELRKYAWFEKKGLFSKISNYYTHPVGQKKPNSLGLYDMTGNVNEWVHDKHDKNAYNEHQRENPIYMKGLPGRCYRGGWIGSKPSECRITSRSAVMQNRGLRAVGFRLVMTYFMGKENSSSVLDFRQAERINSLIEDLKYEVAQAYASTTLKAIGTPAIKPLIKALKDYKSQPFASLALKGIGIPAIDPLIVALKDKKSQTFAALTLKEIGTPAINPLIEALKDEKSQPFASIALKDIGTPAIEPLIIALKDKKSQTFAALTLKEIGTPAINPLIEALKDEKSREFATLALKEIGTPEALNSIK